MPNDPVILAVDLGTSGMKVALITVSGKVLGWESESVKLVLTPDGGAEQSPDEWCDHNPHKRSGFYGIITG